MLNIGLVGTGACGNMAAKLATLMDFPSIALNSSSKDLLAIEDVCPSIVVGDLGGCGKDRSKSKELIKLKYTQIIEEIKPVIENCKIVFVVVGGGGGTGSGAIAILTDILRSFFKNTIFIPTTILPNLTESYIAQQNATECILEVSKLNLPYMLPDNARAYINNGNNLSTIEIFKEINDKVIEDMRILRGDFTNEPSEYGVIDDRDMLKLISTKGLMTISKTTGIKENHLDDKDLSDLIIESIKNSYNVDVERDKIVKRIGFIINLDKTLFSKLDTSYTKVKEYIGTPIEIFEHINIIKEGEPGSIITVMSGLSFPKIRFEQLKKLIEDNKPLIKESETNIEDLKNSIGWIKDDSTVLDNLSENIEEPSTDDISKILGNW